ncbi:hypothetical protein BCV69DRAFT_284500 [Microstroma glucosiphilum]|uniref:Uncharacterized protein n=1 Tax=Pseudomicrostroma glucosiphilum TaxID=1684307 RepID=A0A316U0D9_9BASI|nr:hypothetical protein BCV69DRAFT_284500 [Pseudomicrostroma glucosiphilum]PWN18879.1 hypothetical protein BCV69DRAFT_284500 [Pseudomicrostroma glucosiphilum]
MNGPSSNLFKRGTARSAQGKSFAGPHRGRESQPSTGGMTQQRQIQEPGGLASRSAARWNAGSTFAANNMHAGTDQEAMCLSERSLATDVCSVFPSEDCELESRNDAGSRRFSEHQLHPAETTQRGEAESEEMNSAYSLARLRRQTRDGLQMEYVSSTRGSNHSCWSPDGAFVREVNASDVVRMG